MFDCLLAFLIRSRKHPSCWSLRQLLLLTSHASWSRGLSKGASCGISKPPLSIWGESCLDAYRIWLDTLPGIRAILPGRIHLGFNKVELILLPFDSLPHVLMVDGPAFLDCLDHGSPHELPLHGFFLLLEHLFPPFLFLVLGGLGFLPFIFWSRCSVSHCLWVGLEVLPKGRWC